MSEAQWTLTSHTACGLAQQIILPDGIKLFDIHESPSGSMLFFLDCPWGRSSIAIAPGDAPVGRFHKLLEDFIMAKEIGLKKGASAKAKAYDERMDKKMGYREGSKADIAFDKKAMKKFPAKKGK